MRQCFLYEVIVKCASLYDVHSIFGDTHISIMQIVGNLSLINSCMNTIQKKVSDASTSVFERDLK